MSLFFVNALADPARDFFLKSFSTLKPFDQKVNVMRRHFNTDTRKLQLQSEMGSLVLSSLMREHDITDPTEGLTRVLKQINISALQSPNGFGDDPRVV